jgi:hypothetical protein
VSWVEFILLLPLLFFLFLFLFVYVVYRGVVIKLSLDLLSTQ